MATFTEQVKQFECLKRLQDQPTDTAKNFIIDGHQGAISFITSMTEALSISVLVAIDCDYWLMGISKFVCLILQR